MLKRIFMAVSAFVLSLALVYSHPGVSRADERIAIKNDTEKPVVLSWLYTPEHSPIFNIERLNPGETSTSCVLGEVRTIHVLFRDNDAQYNYAPQSGDIKDGNVLVSQMITVPQVAVKETQKNRSECSLF